MKKKIWLYITLGLTFAPSALAAPDFSQKTLSGELRASEISADARRCLLSENTKQNTGLNTQSEGTAHTAPAPTAINGG